LCVSPSAGPPAVFTLSVCEKWAFSEQASLREGKYLVIIIFFFLSAGAFEEKAKITFFCHVVILWSVLRS